MKVTSPKLRRSGSVLDSRAQNYFCLWPLREYVEVSESTGYWVEASDRRWEDGSGTAASPAARPRSSTSGCCTKTNPAPRDGAGRTTTPLERRGAADLNINMGDIQCY